MLTLYDWKLDWDQYGDVIAKGYVTGHPRLYNGCWIHTSPIMEIAAEEGQLLLTTMSGSHYTLLRETVCQDAQDETGACLASLGLDADVMERCAQARAQAEAGRRAEAEQTLEAGELLLEVVGNTALNALFRTTEGELIEVAPMVHVGMIQDSVLMIDREERAVDFRYFPEKNWLRPYHISDGLRTVKVRNLGGTQVLFGAQGREVPCPAGAVTAVPTAEHDVEGLFSPDAVNGKGLYRTIFGAGADKKDGEDEGKP